MIWKAYDRLIDAGGLAAAALIAFIAFGVTFDVVIRFSFGWTLGWMLEMSEYAMFAATMLGTAWVLREGGHTSIDLVTAALPTSAKAIVERIASAVGLATSLVFCWFALQAAIRSYASGRMIHKTLSFPDWWLMALLVVGMATLAAGFLRRLLGGADTGVISPPSL
jgi:TRAP-type C4-dicarboxylate transport system permease small subunit